LRGTACLYQGEELGLEEADLALHQLKDPFGIAFWPTFKGRDGCRTPMPWADEPGGGFTTASATPWLPFGDLAAHNVAAQAADPGSTLHLTRDLVALRRQEPALRTGAYAALEAPAGGWAWRRGDAFAVGLNLSDDPLVVPDVGGAIAIGTDRARDGESVAGALALAPWEAALVRLA
jgi:alpha-glucosidase